MKYKNVIVKSQCPLCHSEEAKLLYEVDSDFVAEYILSRDHEELYVMRDIIEKLWGQSSCKKLYCTNCKLMYVKPFIAGDQQFYSKIYTSDTKYTDDKWDYDLTLNSIKRKKDKNNLTLLEIGAGKGAFLKKVKPLLKSVSANEISLPIKWSLKRQGIKNYDDLYDENIKEKFNIIASFCVIEHLDDLDNLFKRLHQLLEDGGHLYLSTHETSKVLFFESNNAGLDLPPMHVTCWNIESFKFVCEAYGFELIDCRNNNLTLPRKMVNFGLGFFNERKVNRRIIESNISNIKSKKVRKGFMYVYLAILSPYILYKTLGEEVISTQWVHLKKKEDNNNE